MCIYTCVCIYMCVYICVCIYICICAGHNIRQVGTPLSKLILWEHGRASRGQPALSYVEALKSDTEVLTCMKERAEW